MPRLATIPQADLRDQIVRWRENALDLDIVVDDLRRTVDHAVDELRAAVHARDRAAMHLAHLIAMHAHADLRAVGS